MKTALIYSSLTGNTKKVGEAIFDVLEREKEIFIAEKFDSSRVAEFDRFVIGFWVDKGTANASVRKVISKIKNKEIAFFGTLGAEPDSEHGKKVYRRVSELCGKSNNFKGGFLCLGKVSEKLVEKMGKFPLNLIHPLTPERLARIENAKSHPDGVDLKNAQEFFQTCFN